MDNLLIYIVESLVVMGVFYIAYWLVLRKGTSHRLSRFYLLGTLVLALILPLHFFSFDTIGVKTKKTVSTVVQAKQSYKTIVASIANDQTVFRNKQVHKINDLDQISIPVVQKTDKVSLTRLLINGLLLVYLTGLGFFLLRFIWQINSLRKQIACYETEKEAGIVFVYIDKCSSPYSFLNFLFIPREMKYSSEYNSILEHEKAHIFQLHTYDLLFIELLAVLFWINPFVWFIRLSLRKTHEYLADEQVINSGCEICDYQALLLEELMSAKTVGLTSAFHFKPLKQRLAMIQKKSKIISKRFRLLKAIPVTMIIILWVAIGIVISCANEEERTFQLVTLQGEGHYYNFSTTNFGYILAADSISPTSMLARSGDLFVAFDDIIYHNNRTSYHFIEGDGVLYNNEKIFSIRLSDNQKVKDWLLQLDSIDLSALDHVVLTKKLPENYMDYLRQIAEKKPNVGLNFESWSREDEAILSLFQPRWLVVTCENMNEVMPLPSLPNVEMLTLAIEDGSIEEPLRLLPGLKHLVLSDMNSEVKITSDFLANNQQIESVVCADCAFSDYNFLNKLTNLNSLMVLNTDTTVNLNFVKDLKSLTRLCIMSDYVYNWEVLSECPDLKWLVLSGDISQKEFNAVMETNPKLEVVEIVECDSINSLVALTGLKNLKALTVSDTLRDAQTPLALNNLEYISVPESSMGDSVYVSKLKEAIPNGVIVPNDGFCMGSGWFILFVPGVLVLAWMRRKLFPVIKQA